MALTSYSSSSMPGFEYDVFLSFYGKDTRRKFTDHLYTALKQVGIRTFRDDDALERGRLLGPELKKAICNSAILVIVFSRNYARSKWCLDEVLTIIEEKEKAFSKHEVVPIFYNIDPSDVRNQKGSFEEAFSGYEDLIEAETNPQRKEELSEKVKAWKFSLRMAGSLSGMVLTKEGYEAKFISDVVKDIRKKLDYKTMFNFENLVGVNSNVAEIESWLQDPSLDAVILLVVGMGGIGKTTIAKCIYNLNSRNYDGSSFLADIDDSCNRSGRLCRLQSQLVSEILNCEHEETIWNVHKGTTKVANAICNKKVLLILDDVTTEEQVNALLGRKRFHPGSKVILTTRHKELANAFPFPPKVHTVTELSTCESLKLFSLYCFHQDQPPKPYIIRSIQVVHWCMGLPLALIVFGSSLRGTNDAEWEDTLRKLEEIQDPEILKVLRLSYDFLDDVTEKPLFLHIACFFVKEDKDYIVKILSECNIHPIAGIRKLMDNCLVYEEHGKLVMHQLIKQMGHEVVRQESPDHIGKRSRLWQYEECFEVLQEHKGTKNVIGFMLDMRNMKEPKSGSALEMVNVGRECSFQEYLGTTMHGNKANFKFRALEKMPNILLLQLNYVRFFGKYKKFPKKLRLLSWHGFYGDCIPTDVPLEKLVVLDLRYSKLKCVWKNCKEIKSLKILNLGHCVELIKTPDFRGLPSLESLILKGCLRLTKVDDSIAYLEGLVSLDLTDCRSLRHIPRFPTSLESIQMSGCLNLEGFQCLVGVSVCSLLVKMDISNCNLFDRSFPDDWSNLFSLNELNISGNNITVLPKCIQSLPRLGVLYAKSCSDLRSIIGLPMSLRFLLVYYNTSLEEVQTVNCPTMAILGDSSNLRHIEGMFKLLPIDEVDTKVIRYLGLESITSEGLEVGKPKVLFEYGIFSTIVSDKQIPSKFRYKKKGSSISFTVPSHHSSSRICGLSICFVVSTLEKGGPRFCNVSIEVYNKTKDLSWKYDIDDGRRDKENYGILSLWRCGNLLEDGDEITVHIVLDAPGFGKRWTAEESCINIVYEDDGDHEEVDGEIKGLDVFDQILWTDRMYIDISDYIHHGKHYVFRSVIMFEDEDVEVETDRFRVPCSRINAYKQWRRYIKSGEIS